MTFSWKDYRQNRKAKVMTLDADEFIRRFLLHTLPDGFHRTFARLYIGGGFDARRIAPLVGLDAHEAAGGTVTRDLLSDAADTYLTNRDLLNRLAQKALESGQGRGRGGPSGSGCWDR